MLKMWHDLKKKFHVGGNITQTTHYVELIAMLIFWWIYKQELETSSRRKAFRAFFGLELNDRRN